MTRLSHPLLGTRQFFFPTPRLFHGNMVTITDEEERLEGTEGAQLQSGMSNLVKQHLSACPPQLETRNPCNYSEASNGGIKPSPMELNVPAEANFGGCFLCPDQDLCPVTKRAAESTVTNIGVCSYGEHAKYLLNGSRASPGLYLDDGDMRLPSSSLSTASAPSAPSSAIGSPQSHHDQPGAVLEWSNQGLAVQPTVVGSDYVIGAGYLSGAGLEDWGGFDLGATQAKAFVGKFRAPRVRDGDEKAIGHDRTVIP